MSSPHIFYVKPKLPEKLKLLEVLALDLNWPEKLETVELFRRINPELWEQTGHNPVLLLRQAREEQLLAAVADQDYMEKLSRVWQQYREYHDNRETWNRRHGPGGNTVIAYFSAEFGLSQSLPIYAGGLGVLAGDHLKSASDLGLPLVGVGLLYREGYFRQRIDRQGWQREYYSINDFYQLPLEMVHKDDGSPLMVQVNHPERQLYVQAWVARVGRIKLYLLDTYVEANQDVDRHITNRLYGGNQEKRIQQEIVLGIGGVRVLEALGLDPVICHLNEGHSAFLALERIRFLQEKHGLDFETAKEQSASGHIFTTHTPVAAGFDLFPPYLMDKYFTDYYQSLGLNRHSFLALGRKDANNQQEPFNMAVLALRLSGWSNAVSKLHGRTARCMWQGIWCGLPEEEIPITSITNGVHIKSWTGGRMESLFDRYLGSVWWEDPSGCDWSRVEKIPDEELWQAHEAQRRELLSFTRERLVTQVKTRGAGQKEIEESRNVLLPGALTIGFARRFATYKRPSLLFRNPERLAAIVGNEERPVQIIYAGKAHPHDEGGKKVIQQIIHFSHEEPFKSRIVFIEDYDINVASHLVQGVDLWLGNPRRPLEASSTSGMKAVVNGALHVSTLDGWWDEAWNPDAGWAIGCGESYLENEYQDEMEAEALYNLLEKEIIPLFYDRDGEGLPREWLNKMKKSIRLYSKTYNTHRMVQEYCTSFYVPAAELYLRLRENNFRDVRELTAWKRKIKDAWLGIKIENVGDDRVHNMETGDELTVSTVVSLGQLEPGDVNVEIYYGIVDSCGVLVEGKRTRLTSFENLGEGRYLYRGVIRCCRSGRQGYNIRVSPYHRDLAPLNFKELIVWG